MMVVLRKGFFLKKKSSKMNREVGYDNKHWNGATGSHKKVRYQIQYQHLV